MLPNTYLVFKNFVADINKIQLGENETNISLNMGKQSETKITQNSLINSPLVSPISKQYQYKTSMSHLQIRVATHTSSVATAKFPNKV